MLTTLQQLCYIIRTRVTTRWKLRYQKVGHITTFCKRKETTENRNNMSRRYERTITTIHICDLMQSHKLIKKSLSQHFYLKLRPHLTFMTEHCLQTRLHWENYIFISFQIEWDMVVVTVFLFNFEPNGIPFGSKYRSSVAYGSAET